MAMENKEIASVLWKIALLLEVEQADGFRIRAYRNAADSIKYMDPPLARMVADGEKLTDVQDIGPAIAKKIEELVTTGRLEYFEKLKQESTPGVLELLTVPGLGPGKVRALRDAGIDSVAVLREAATDGRLAQVQGFGAKTIEALLERLAEREG